MTEVASGSGRAVSAEPLNDVQNVRQLEKTLGVEPTHLRSLTSKRRLFKQWKF